MRVKKTVAMVVILVGLLGVFAPGASAAPGWYFCKVDQIGLGSGTCYISLTDMAASPAFTNRWFVLNPANQKELLAIVLTAITNDMVVQVNVDPVQYSLVGVMYVLK